MHPGLLTAPLIAVIMSCLRAAVPVNGSDLPVLPDFPFLKQAVN